MWTPTHAHVIVRGAENLLTKGKNGTNNAFVVIELGKETYRTSVKEKSGKSVVWNEECELKIPKMGNTACLVLTAMHRNSLGLDQFLGVVQIPLGTFDKLERSTKWFKLEGKPGKEKGKDKVRGEIEVEISFSSKQSQSLISLEGKAKSSVGQLTGSLFGLRQGDGKKRLKKFTGSFRKSAFRSKKAAVTDEDFPESDGPISNNVNSVASGSFSNLDPGVISDDEESSSRKSFESSSSQPESQLERASSVSSAVPPSRKPRLMKNPQISITFCDDDGKPHYGSVSDIKSESSAFSEKRKKSPKLRDLRNERLTDRRLSTSCVDFYILSSPKPEKKFFSSFYLNQTDSTKTLLKFARKLKNFNSLEKKETGKRTVIGCEAAGGEKTDSGGSGSPRTQFKNKNKDELIRMVADLQKRVNCVSVRVKDLEDYLDDLLVKVMETVPKILEKS